MTVDPLATVPSRGGVAPVDADAPPRAERIRVGLQVTDPLTAAGLRRWLRRGIDVVPAPEPSTAEVVVVVPEPMPEVWLRRAVAAGRAASPDACVVVVVDGPGTLSAASLDADLLVSRAELSEETFLAAVGAAAAGAAGAIAVEPASPDETPGDERAAVVLGMLADGHDLAEIASALFYSERTVKNVLYNYLGEIGARNRVHAVACAIRAGLV